MDTAATIRTIDRPRFGQPLRGEGGVFIAVMKGDAGQPDYLLILHPTLNGKAPWKDQMAWAKGLKHEGHTDYRLPTRRELHALIANHKEAFNNDWFWSCEPHGSHYAWCQRFSDGSQGRSGQSNDGIRGCAVRSVILQ